MRLLGPTGFYGAASSHASGRRSPLKPLEEHPEASSGHAVRALPKERLFLLRIF
ncbi:MAG: hypothetical protein R2825_21765 [Saprospiraceae bacterium]